MEEIQIINLLAENATTGPVRVTKNHMQISSKAFLYKKIPQKLLEELIKNKVRFYFIDCDLVFDRSNLNTKLWQD